MRTLPLSPLQFIGGKFSVPLPSLTDKYERVRDKCMRTQTQVRWENMFHLQSRTRYMLFLFLVGMTMSFFFFLWGGGRGGLG